MTTTQDLKLGGVTARMAYNGRTFLGAAIYNSTGWRDTNVKTIRGVIKAAERLNTRDGGDMRDQHGHLYAVTSDGPTYLTECCLASVSIFTDDGSVYCKGCYCDADEALCGLPVLAHAS